MRRDIDSHVENCEYRLVECMHCKNSYYAYEINSHQYAKCDEMPVFYILNLLDGLQHL